jgi:hypothetical protein
MLREQEIHVLNMIPRPVRHIHFFTEHVSSARRWSDNTIPGHGQQWDEKLFSIQHTELPRGCQEK